MKKITLLALCIGFTLLAFAQPSKLTNHTRAFVDAQKKATTAEQREQLRKTFALKVANNSDEYVSAYVHFYDADADKSIVEQYGVLIDYDFGDCVTARIPVTNLEALSQNENIKLLEIGTPVRMRMDQARPAANVDKVQAGTGLSQPFLGTGVVVGVVDGGFQYNHITFYDANNPSELRVKRVWNQSTNKKYTTQSAIESAQYDDTTEGTGHATHVTGIAAGSYAGNSYYGVASDADIVMVSYGSTNTSILNGIMYIFDYATTTNQPAVVNLSLGSHIGPHDGTSTFDTKLDGMVGPGRIICGAAGNEGDSKLFLQQTLTQDQTITQPLTLSHYYSYGESYYLPEIDIWGEPNKDYSIQVVITKSGSEVWSSDIFAANTTSEKTYKSFTGASGGLSIYAGKNTTNKKGNVTIFYDENYGFTLNSGYVLNVRFIGTNAGTIQAWADGYECKWKNGSTNSTIGELGGTANNIITVGAWTTQSNTYSFGDATDEIAPFSSLGPTADGRVKPEITAPGDVIMSSIPDLKSIQADGKTSKKVGSKTYYWGYMSGTSMATPFVTGVVATWLQANPNLTPEQIKEIMAQTAQTDSYTGTCPNNTWGYGKIDAYAGLLKVLETTDIKHLETLPDAIMLYPNPSDGAFKLFFKQNDNNVNIRIYAANGQQVYAQRIGAVDGQQTLDIDAVGIASGAYIVKIAGDNTNTTCRLIVR